jgi:hypothetical protein
MSKYSANIGLVFGIVVMGFIFAAEPLKYFAPDPTVNAGDLETVYHQGILSKSDFLRANGGTLRIFEQISSGHISLATYMPEKTYHLHVGGIYNGKQMHSSALRVLDILGTSEINDPRDKHCVDLSFEKRGETITYRLNEKDTYVVERKSIEQCIVDAIVFLKDRDAESTKKGERTSLDMPNDDGVLPLIARNTWLTSKGKIL